jgi:transposase-like protein
MVGVAPSTLRTWDRRYGLGPSGRAAGSHRRYTDADIARLRRMLSLTARGMPPAAAATGAAEGTIPGTRRDGGAVAAAAGADAAARGLARAAERLDVPLMRWVMESLIRERGVVAAWEHAIAPVIAELGLRYVEHGAGTEIEHLLTRTAGHALAGVPTPAEAGRLPAMLACAPEEAHELPMAVLAAALAERGLDSRNLGARVPAEALLAARARLAPMTVVVWAHDPGCARLVPVRELARSPGLVALAAGPGWGSAEPPAGLPVLESLSAEIAAVASRAGEPAASRRC